MGEEEGLEHGAQGRGRASCPAYSCVEILVALYYVPILKVDPKRPHWQERDRFVLSKGQAAAALYACLAGLGFSRKRTHDLYL